MLNSWTIENQFNIKTPNVTYVAVGVGSTEREQLINARLIVKAPQMLDILVKLASKQIVPSMDIHDLIKEIERG